MDDKIYRLKLLSSARILAPSAGQYGWRLLFAYF